MESKKSGIVTLYGNNNFGNRLQNYAGYNATANDNVVPEQ